MIDSSEPLVTIGVPVYNGERFLAECLDSLLSQRFRNFVLLISDNASTDGTEKICQTYVKADSRVRYHRNRTNIGLYADDARRFPGIDGRRLVAGTLPS